MRAPVPGPCEEAVLVRGTTARVGTQAEAARAPQEPDVRPAAEWSAPSRVHSRLRETGDARHSLLWNATDRARRLVGSFAVSGAPTGLDLWTGRSAPRALHREGDGRTEVPVDLAPHATAVLAFPAGDRRAHATSSTADAVVAAEPGTVEVRDARGGAHTVRVSDGSTRTVRLPAVADEPVTVGSAVHGGPWRLQVTTYGPEGRAERPAVPLAKSADWRTTPGPTTECGIGTYTAEVAVPAARTGRERGPPSTRARSRAVSRCQ